MSIVAVIAKLPETVNKLALAYQESAVRVDALDGAVHDLLHYLSMFGWIAVVYEKLGTDAADGLSHTIALSVVGETDRAGVGRQQTIFEVIGLSIGTGRCRVSVRVVGVGCESVVFVIGLSGRSNSSQGRVPAQSVAR